jgi:hypothetical protein
MMDYRIAYSRQNLLVGADSFSEIDIDDELDPGELHRKLSRQVTQMGYQISDENMGILRRPIGEAVGDVLCVLHGVATFPYANAGVVVYGMLKNQQPRNIWYETHLRVCINGEYYPMERRSNLSALVSGKVDVIERIPEEVVRKEKARWLFPEAQQALPNLKAKLSSDTSFVADFLRSQRSTRSARPGREHAGTVHETG